MTNYQTENYRIDIFEDETFKVNSVDNVNNYDLVHIKESEFRCSTIFGIKVFVGDTVLKSAVIGSTGGGSGIHEKSIIIESDRLLICCSDSIFCISLPELILLWKTRADEATCFEIYKYYDDYIVHGENEISRVDKYGNIVWQKSGGDIFTTIDGKDDFVLTEDYILATDWEGRRYKFDLNGNLLKI